MPEHALRSHTYTGRLGSTCGKSPRFSTFSIDFSVVEEIKEFDGANVFPRTFQDTFGFGLPVTRHTTVKFLLPTFVDCTIGVSENDIGSEKEYDFC